MKKLIGISTIAFLLGTIGAIAQTQPGSPGVTKDAVGEKEGYQANNPNRTPGTNTNPTSPGIRGSGANVTDKEGLNANDPARTGGGTTTTNPGSAASVGQRTDKN